MNPSTARNPGYIVSILLIFSYHIANKEQSIGLQQLSNCWDSRPWRSSSSSLCKSNTYLREKSPFLGPYKDPYLIRSSSSLCIHDTPTQPHTTRRIRRTVTTSAKSNVNKITDEVCYYRVLKEPKANG